MEVNDTKQKKSQAKILLIILSLLCLGGTIVSSVFITKYLNLKKEFDSLDKITLSDESNKNIMRQNQGTATFLFTTNDNRISTNNLTALVQANGQTNLLLEEKAYCHVYNKTIACIVYYDASYVTYNEVQKFDLIFNFSNGETSFSERENNFSLSYTNVIGDNLLTPLNYCFSNIAETDNRSISLYLSNNDTSLITKPEDINVSINKYSSDSKINLGNPIISLSENKEIINLNISYTSEGEGDFLSFGLNVNGLLFDDLYLYSLDNIVPLNKTIVTDKTNNDLLSFQLADDSDEYTYKVKMQNLNRSSCESFTQLTLGAVTKNGSSLTVPIYLLDNYVSNRANMTFDIEVTCLNPDETTNYVKYISGYTYSYNGPHFSQDYNNTTKSFVISEPNVPSELTYTFTSSYYLLGNKSIEVTGEINSTYYMNWAKIEKIDVSHDDLKNLTVKITLPAISEEQFKRLLNKEGRCQIDLTINDKKNNIKSGYTRYKILVEYKEKTLEE